MATNLNPMRQPVTVGLRIRDALDCATMQLRARELASALGFSRTQAEEIVLVVAELAANLVRHAGYGDLTLTPLHVAERNGIEVQAEDQGPGIIDINRSLADGYSSVGGLGYGLGTVNRLMDEMDISSRPGLGTRVVCRRWVRPAAEFAILERWEVGAGTRSRRGARENGDAFVIREWPGKLLVGLIDGVGHGEFAQKAALAAQDYVRGHYELPLDLLFSGVNRACHGTRGVVMALARFESATRMTFASMGNIEARVCGGPPHLLSTVQRGILGMGERSTIVQEHDWKPDWLLVLHTDGLKEHWLWSDFPGVERESAQMIVRRLLRDVKPRDDDASILAVKALRP